jgi:putative transcriptional regulator
MVACFTLSRVVPHPYCPGAGSVTSVFSSFSSLLSAAYIILSTMKPTIIASLLFQTFLVCVLVIDGALTFTSFSALSRRSNSCFMSKNADRAHTEHILESMMGNDWRVFRAKLVAQEQADALQLKSAASGIGYGNLPFQQEKKPLHHLITGAFSSLFGARDLASLKFPPPKRNSSDQSDTRISKNHTRIVYIGGSPVPVEDPFASEDELLLMMEPKIILDQHRWAHPISHIEPGCVLIANEKLGGLFHQSVVLIIEHNDKAGTIGVIINR